MAPCAALLLALAALAGARPAAGQEGGVPLRLAELGSPAAADRARAERWLAAHLRAEDQALVARAAEEGDAEVRRRLAAAVGAEERSFALAALLARSASPAAAAVGREALGELAARFCPALDDPPLFGTELVRALRARGREGSVRLLRADLAAPPAETLQLLRRCGEPVLPIALDPAARQRADRRAAADEVPYLASWDHLLVTLAGAHRLRVASFGLDADGELEGGAFLRLSPSGGEEHGTAREVLLGWVTEGEEAGRGRRFAALLDTGWPAARTWIEGLAEAGDEAAFDALIGGAEGGVWPLCWKRRATLERLLAGLRLALAGGDRAAAERIAHALAAAPARLADGTPVAEVLGAAWESAGPDAGAAERERLLLLVALEGQGAADARFEERVRAMLAARETEASAPFLRQALRVFDACFAHAGGDAQPLALGAPVSLLGPREGWSAAAYRELGALLRSSGARPPAELLDPASLAGSGLHPSLAEPRSALVAWYAGAGEVDAAAGVLLATPGREPVFGELLRRLVVSGDGALAASVLARARALAPDDAAREGIDRVALLAGLLDAERRSAFLGRAAELAPRDVALLGALAGVPGAEAEPARVALLDGLSAALAEDLSLESVLPYTEALERALADLLRADADASELRDAARQRVQEARAGTNARGANAKSQLAAAGWPPLPPELDALDLGLLRRP